MSEPDPDEDLEPTLFDDQDPEAEVPTPAELCLRCRLTIDPRHTPEACEKGRLWYLARRAEFEALTWD